MDFSPFLGSWSGENALYLHGPDGPVSHCTTTLRAALIAGNFLHITYDWSHEDKPYNGVLLVNTTGNPGMASGGMGDVLSGVIATLAANELPPSIAAAAGAFWHGYAGDLCAKEMASIGYSASDVANALPKARAEITTRAFTDA